MASLKYRFLFAGGGTGGHLFPALAVAEELKKTDKNCEILFVGNKNKIEARLVPQHGYSFKSIWIKGFSRKLTFQSFVFPLRLIVSLVQSLAISAKFKPVVAIGTGGYVSGPAIWGAKVLGAKIVILEQNSYPGITTRLLEKYADEIHVAFEKSKEYLRMKDRIFNSGNPTRILNPDTGKGELREKFELEKGKKILLVLGGSLGAKKINETIANCIEQFKENGIQVLWQTGERYFESYNHFNQKGIKVVSFLDNIYQAYEVADLVVARSGATTLAELSSLQKPAILIPSPNVAENHQYHNAKDLAEKNACILIEEKNIADSAIPPTADSTETISGNTIDLFGEVEKIINDESKLNELKNNIKLFSKPDSASVIARRIFALANRGVYV